LLDTGEPFSGSRNQGRILLSMQFVAVELDPGGFFYFFYFFCLRREQHNDF